MQTITIGSEKYDLEFTFAAAEEKGLVQALFKVVSGAYFFSDPDEKNMMNAVINGTAEMVGDLPAISKMAFYAGLKEHQPEITAEQAENLMKAYMRENKISFNGIYQLLKTQMEEDGFFDLTGIKEMVSQMEAEAKKETKKAPKNPTDHLRKSTGKK